ncbi:hypothetical protein [Sporolituus thermophilus]|uniref:Uncharacterized protein n=1 Tax=Sporolituus thermophilus DSM 23256 TaxID=1123285 RepID=A0A1G7MBW5_9FIRM|nr:hypothetical protein [Sporolituus thermophilus]SDF59136.1 hypothetical protein SAMN05660235_02088 [Sporolituus thermophilus DSM 23256]
MQELREELLNKVRAAAPDGKLSCAAAQELAQSEGVPPLVIGRAADVLGIKIRDCQLGCFGARKE